MKNESRLQLECQPQEEAALDLRSYLDAFLRRKKLVFFVTVATLVLAMAVVILLPSRYRSTATILVEAQEIPKELVKTTVGGYVEERIQTISQIVLSRQNLQKIIAENKLYPELQDSYTSEEIIEKMRKDIMLEPVTADVASSSPGRPASATIAFTLSYVGKQPAVVGRVANTLVSLFLEENYKSREEKAGVAVDFLEREVDKLRQEIGDTEARIAIFKEQNVFTLPELTQLNLQMLERLERDQETAQITVRGLLERKSYLEGQIAVLEPNKNLVSLDGRRVMTLDEEIRSTRTQLATQRAALSEAHPDVIRLKRQLAALESQAVSGRVEAAPAADSPKLGELEKRRVELESLKGKFGAKHPDVLKAASEVRRLESEVAKDSARPAQKRLTSEPDNPAYVTLTAQLNAVQLEIQNTRKQMAEYAAKSAEYQRRVENSPKVEQAYRMLQRDLTTSQAKYQDTLIRLQAAREGKGMEEKRISERLTLIDPPVAPEKPYKPNRLLLTLVAIVLSMGMGGASGVLAEFTDRSVRRPEEIQRLVSAPVLVSIPVMTTAEDVSRTRRSWAFFALGCLAALVLVVVLVDSFFMPLDVLWFTILKKLQLVM